ncbi:MAG TPA: type VI secretion system lipoprotein TssJ [Desulfobacterales bacterium]|nr:type VI secretion system lipoprotein TssJ [Desulfobacterales bacterium]
MNNINNKFKLLCGILSFLLLAACAASPPPPPQYTYGRDAIKIHIKADPELNQYNGSPHTLLLCVQQLSNPNTFSQLSGDMAGIYKLLGCSRYDSTVTNSRRIIVQPGQVAEYSLDRAENTKYVSVATGYYNVQKENVVRLIKIPVVVKTKGVFSRTRTSEPAILNLELDLGPSGPLEIKNIAGGHQ